MANPQNMQNLEKVTLEEYNQWLQNPVTKAFLCLMHNQGLKLNQLTALELPTTLEKVVERRTQAQVILTVASLAGVKESICHPEKKGDGK